MRTQNGDTSAVRLRKHWHTECPSIQGPWTPFTFKHPKFNIATYPNAEFSQPLNKEQSASEKLLELFEKQKLEAANEKDQKETVKQ